MQRTGVMEKDGQTDKVATACVKIECRLAKISKTASIRHLRKDTKIGKGSLVDAKSLSRKNLHKKLCCKPKIKQKK